MNQLFSLKQPVVFAHRGASGYAPENTLAAFSHALKLGAEAIELDVKLTRDGQVVVLHDQTVDRTTSGHGDLREFTLAQVQELDAGSHFSAQFAGEKVPSLEQVFEQFGKKLFINIELTNYQTYGDGLTDKVIELIDRFGLDEWVMFSSFNPSNILRARKLKPGIPAAMLALPGSPGRMQRSFAGKWISPGLIHPSLEDVNPGFMRREQKRGRRVHAWTVNDPDDITRMFLLGVNGIFTDFPDRAIQIRESM
jgi:glycerophosphoryl diester phosphodiesterase